jgi:endonuclease III
MIPNFEKIYSVFKKYYIFVPLEVFKKDPYKTLVSTVLSSRTKDEVTLEASKRLFRKAPNIKALDLTSQPEIVNLIYPVGFYKTKSKHLKELAKIIIKNYKGKIPATRKELVGLPGVGRKTANLVLNRAFGTPSIAVDTHVHRISNLLGWVNTKNPEQTEKELINMLPKKYWSDTNRLFVSIGRRFTTRRKLEEFLKKEGLFKNLLR